LFDADGRLIAQAEHIPVHLGAMPAAVAAVRERDSKPGDVFVLNDPFTGGTHLPDVTMVSPLAPGRDGSDDDDGESDLDGGTEGRNGDDIVGYAVSRAHHADVGGMTPGACRPTRGRSTRRDSSSHRPGSSRAGKSGRKSARSSLANVRNPRERRADLRAQRARTRRGPARVAVQRARPRDRPRGVRRGDRLLSRARRTRDRGAPDGTYEATDVLEGDGVTDEDIEISVAVTVDGERIDVDFSGTDDQLAGNLNAPLAVAKSAVYFVVRCLTDPEIPPNHGCYEPVEISAPERSLLDPEPPAAVVGNVETSQRVTDAVFTALARAAPDRVPAQGQGTMNNLTIGARDGSVTYYETIGGGFGARPDRDGMDGVQVGMTNTLNTPVEALETEYPSGSKSYALRESGGRGRYRGGRTRALGHRRDRRDGVVTDRAPTPRAEGSRRRRRRDRREPDRRRGGAGEDDRRRGGRDDGHRQDTRRRRTREARGGGVGARGRPRLLSGDGGL